MADTQRTFKISSWALVLALPPLAILFLGDWAFELVAPQGRFLAPAAADTGVARHLIPTARLLTITALFVGGGAAFAALGLFLRDLWRYFEPDAQRLLGLTALGLFSCGILGTFAGGSLDRVSNYLGTDFMASVTCQFSQIEKIEVLSTGIATAKPGASSKAAGTQAPAGQPKPAILSKAGATPKPTVALKSCSKREVLGLFKSLVTASLVLLSIGATAAVFGAISCLGREPAGDDAKRLAALRLQRRRLQAYINISAALMVATLIFLISWTYWPRFLFTAPRLAAYDAHINAIAIYFGVIYSLVILSFAAPITLILRGRWQDLTLTDPTAEDIGTFDGSTLTNLGKLLAVFAPAIAAAIPVLTDLVGKA